MLKNEILCNETFQNVHNKTQTDYKQRQIYLQKEWEIKDKKKNL